MVMVGWTKGGGGGDWPEVLRSLLVGDLVGRGELLGLEPTLVVGVLRDLVLPTLMYLTKTLLAGGGCGGLGAWSVPVVPHLDSKTRHSQSRAEDTLGFEIAVLCRPSRHDLLVIERRVATPAGRASCHGDHHGGGPRRWVRRSGALPGCTDFRTAR